MLKLSTISLSTTHRHGFSLALPRQLLKVLIIMRIIVIAAFLAGTSREKKHPFPVSSLTRVA
jgi:hypothetical protein